ncbi:MAG: FHA domain-containing protein [Clostridia bacterium]|nr:FHA domain-containing protein [Clostridia bacterium]
MAKTVFFDAHASKSAALVLFNKEQVLGTNRLNILTSIGRATERSTCDIKINAPIVSRSHGEIAFIDGEYYYRDLNSTNGTYINNVLIGKNSPVNQQVKQLQDGDILCFDIRQNGKSRPDCVYALFTTFGNTNCKWSSLALESDIVEVCIGRSGQSALQINSDVISEKHASFFFTSNGWAIIDHQSTNGVYLNGKRMSAPRYLEAFDVVRIADTYLIFTGDRLLFSNGIANFEEQPVQSQPSLAVAETPVRSTVNPGQPKTDGQLIINITERSVMQRFRKMLLLQDINLSVSNGEMVLILGGSGAGKTTFINAVMGYEKASGKILYKDTDIYAEYEQMKYEIGFVPQQDLLRGSDTVYDTLSNAAEMKLPRKISYEDREHRIDIVLDQLGLSREKETLVSKLSGGQRKRLSIAVEFIANPSLFFLDEPDSGLDDIMGRSLMENLRTIADQGKIVMVITHSPERASDLFDKVIVLAKSTKDNCGHLAFYGSVSEAFKFFEVSSFREIVKKINRPDENGEGLSDFFIDKYAVYSKE